MALYARTRRNARDDQVSATDRESATAHHPTDATELQQPQPLVSWMPLLPQRTQRELIEHITSSQVFDVSRHECSLVAEFEQAVKELGEVGDQEAVQALSRLSYPEDGEVDARVESAVLGALIRLDSRNWRVSIEDWFQINRTLNGALVSTDSRRHSHVLQSVVRSHGLREIFDPKIMPQIGSEHDRAMYSELTELAEIRKKYPLEYFRNTDPNEVSGRPTEQYVAAVKPLLLGRLGRHDITGERHALRSSELDAALEELAYLDQTEALRYSVGLLKSPQEDRHLAGFRTIVRATLSRQIEDVEGRNVPYLEQLVCETIRAGRFPKQYSKIGNVRYALSAFLDMISAVSPADGEAKYWAQWLMRTGDPRAVPEVRRLRSAVANQPLPVSSAADSKSRREDDDAWKLTKENLLSDIDRFIERHTSRPSRRPGRY